MVVEIRTLFQDTKGGYVYTMACDQGNILYTRTQQLVNIIVTLLSGVVHPLMKRLVTEHPEYFCPVAMLPYLLASRCMRQPLVYRSSDSL